MTTQETFAQRERTVAVRPGRSVGPGVIALGLLGVLLGALLLSGLLGSGGPGQQGAAPGTTAAVAGPGPQDAGTSTTRPTRLRIPEIGVDTTLMQLGLTADRELEVPPLSRAGVAGWYRLSPSPGDVGPAIIAGHVDSKSAPAVFYRLHELVAGDRIRVTRSDRREAVFAVDRVERVAKAAFPTQRVYGATRRPELRLITCGGAFDQSTGHYVDNVVVFAHIVSLAPAGERIPSEEHRP